MRKVSLLVSVVGLVALFGGCAPKEEAPPPEPAAEPTAEPAPEEAAPMTATAVLQPRADQQLSGTVTFTETVGGVSIVAHITGATAGLHGIHLHEIGDCSAEDFTSTGGHFNPTGAPHGAPTDAERHAGDFGNIEIDEYGAGHLELMSDLLTLTAGANTVVGRAVILHEGEDDLVSQPTGAAGGRIACGVVTLEGEAAMEEAAAAAGEAGEGAEGAD